MNKNSAEGYVAPEKDYVTLSDTALYLYLIGFQSFGPGQ